MRGLYAPSRPGHTAGYLALAEAKLHLRVDHNDENTLIESLIRAATEHLDGWAGILDRCLIERVWRQDHDRFSREIIIPLTAFALLIDMPELGTLKNGQAASLAGLAPIARQSGKWIGRAFIRGGRSTVRQALYMPALVAIRFNQDFKAKYDQFKKAEKASKVAITTIMRKMTILANALLRNGRKWTQSMT